MTSAKPEPSQDITEWLQSVGAYVGSGLFVLGGFLWLIAGISIIVAAEMWMEVYDQYKVVLSEFAVRVVGNFMASVEEYISFKDNFPALDNDPAKLMIVAILALIVSIPCIRYLPTLFAPTAIDEEVKIRRAIRLLASWVAVLIAVWLIWRTVSMGRGGEGFHGPLDIALPVVMTFYFFAVWSALERRLDI